MLIHTYQTICLIIICLLSSSVLLTSTCQRHSDERSGKRTGGQTGRHNEHYMRGCLLCVHEQRWKQTNKWIKCAKTKQSYISTCSTSQHSTCIRPIPCTNKMMSFMILLSSFVNGSNHTGSSHVVAFFGRFYRLRNIFYSINDFIF